MINVMEFEVNVGPSVFFQFVLVFYEGKNLYLQEVEMVAHVTEFEVDVGPSVCVRVTGSC